MTHQSVYAIATSEEQAYQIIDQLTDAGFTTNDISALLPDKNSTHEFSHRKSTKAPEGAITGASAGGALGGVLGLLAGAGALALPGAGSLLAAGPLLAALSGAAAGVAVGGIAGGLIGMGIPEIEAKRYENRLAQGNILISVHATTNGEVRRAKDVLRSAGAQDVAVAVMRQTTGH